MSPNNEAFFPRTAVPEAVECTYLRGANEQRSELWQLQSMTLCEQKKNSLVIEEISNGRKSYNVPSDPLQYQNSVDGVQKLEVQQICTSAKSSKWLLVTSRRRCGDRAGPWGCGSDPGRCCRPGTACLSDAPLGWCARPRASPWRRTFRGADDESTQPAERREGKKCHECHFQAWECSANWSQQVPGTNVNKAV